jgi:hypothetical protein
MLKRIALLFGKLRRAILKIALQQYSASDSLAACKRFEGLAGEF